MKFVVMYLFLLSAVSITICQEKSDSTDKIVRTMGHDDDAIPITEDLMREHGILNRTLLIYDEIIRRIDKNIVFDSQDLLGAIDVIKSFIEDYHEKIEEDYIFPLFKNHKKSSLVKTLKKQHDKGREMTTQLKSLAQSKKLNHTTKKKIKSLLQQFIHMYRPHESREDTILFPLVRSLVSDKEFEHLSKLSDDLEHQIFGQDGFELMLKKVITIEKSLGIYTLAQFTPQ